MTIRTGHRLMGEKRVKAASCSPAGIIIFAAGTVASLWRGHGCLLRRNGPGAGSAVETVRKLD